MVLIVFKRLRTQMRHGNITPYKSSSTYFKLWLSQEWASALSSALILAWPNLEDIMHSGACRRASTGDRRDAVIDDVAGKRCPPIFRQFSSLEWWHRVPPTAPLPPLPLRRPETARAALNLNGMNL